MALPAGLSTFTLNGGPYPDELGGVRFAGMVGKLSLTAPIRYNGAEVGGTTPVTIASDGTWSVGPLVNPSDPAVASQGVAYRMEWQVGRFDDCPGGSRSVTFTVAAGTSTADYDVVTPVSASAVSGPVSLPFVTSVNGHAGTVATGDLGIGAAFVVHGASASVTRPSSSMPVVWFGSVAPTNADAALDVWIPVSSDGGAAALASLQAALAAKADLTGGVVPDAELPARLSDAGLKAAYVPFWAPGETVGTGAVRMSPTGQTITRNASGTTRGSYDTTEQALWTVTASGSGGAVVAITDNGDGTATTTSGSVTDNGDGTATAA